MITKPEIYAALKKHQETIKDLKQAILQNDGEKVAVHLEAMGCSLDAVEKLLVAKYPDFLEEIEEEEEEIEEEEEEEEDDDEGEEEEEEEDDE